VCARGDGIRRSKDLRAEIGKFPNSTNERKQMSIKTLKKRIALVAVSTLTAGVFSAVSAPVANASTLYFGTNVAAAGATTNPKLAIADTLYIASQPSITGAGVALTASTTAPGSTDATMPNTHTARSLGLVNVSDIAGGLTAGTTTTAVLLSTGRLSVYASTTSAQYSAITVTGGTIVSSTGTSMNSTATIAGSGAAAAVTNWGIVAAPSSGSTQMIVRYYAAAGSSADAAVGSPTSGVLAGQITVTIASASTAGVISPANTTLFGATSATDQNQTTADDSSFSARVPYTSDIFLHAVVKDAYGTAFDNGVSGVLAATATNGALVNINASNVSTDGTTSTAYLSTATPNDDMIRVSAPGVAPVTTTVTVTFNGTLIGSRTLVFTGEIAKIELYGPVVGKTSNSSNTNFAYYRLFDAASNPIYSTQATVAVAAYTPNALLGNAALQTTTVGAVTKVETSAITAAGVVTNGKVSFACGSTAGSGRIGLTYTNASGTVITSNALNVSCAGAAFTYTASWDKATYSPGDIAKLTVSFKDSAGNAANDVDTIVTSSNTATVGVVAVGGLDKTVSGPSTGDVLDGSKITYTYTVGANEGTFAGSVVFSDVDQRQVSATGAKAAVTTTLVVKSATATVTNADVLKSIVSLIASINKQIQALQKLILRR
jgi:hypothetical protein